MAIDRSRCYSCKKGVAFGNNRSHANNATRRTWKPNLQVARVLDASGKIVKVKVCTRCLAAGKIKRAPRGGAAAWPLARPAARRQRGPIGLPLFFTVHRTAGSQIIALN